MVGRNFGAAIMIARFLALVEVWGASLLARRYGAAQYRHPTRSIAFGETQSEFSAMSREQFSDYLRQHCGIWHF
jgi:hypothetical protein